MKNQKLSISGRIGVLTGVIVLAAISSLIVYGASGLIIDNQHVVCGTIEDPKICDGMDHCYYQDGVCYDYKEPAPLKDSPFDDYKTDKIDNILSGEKWDQLMDLLNRVDELTVPSGAIMAFDSKDGCPEGWELWTKGDDKFLMGGASDDVGNEGGNKYIKLNANQLPNHSHGVYDYLSTPNGEGEVNVGYNKLLGGVKVNVGVHKYDDSNEYATRRVQTDNDVKGFQPYIEHSTISAGNNADIDITNPYVKVIFCKKSDKKHVPIDGECSSYTRFTCNQGQLIQNSMKNNNYEYKWTCKGLYGGKDAYCIQCKNDQFSADQMYNVSAKKLQYSRDVRVALPGQEDQYCYQDGQCSSFIEGVGSDITQVQNKCKQGIKGNGKSIKNASARRSCIGEGKTDNKVEYCFICPKGARPETIDGEIICNNINSSNPVMGVFYFGENNIRKTPHGGALVSDG